MLAKNTHRSPGHWVSVPYTCNEQWRLYCGSPGCSLSGSVSITDLLVYNTALQAASSPECTDAINLLDYIMALQAVGSLCHTKINQGSLYTMAPQAAGSPGHTNEKGWLENMALQAVSYC